MGRPLTAKGQAIGQGHSRQLVLCTPCICYGLGIRFFFLWGTHYDSVWSMPDGRYNAMML